MPAKEESSAGVPEWVVTYGDMMSLLLTFFIMLVSLSDVVADKKFRAVMEAIQQYIGYRASPLTPPGQNFPLNSYVEKLTTLGSFTDNANSRGGIRFKGPEGVDVRVFHTHDGIQEKIGNPVYFEKESDRIRKDSEDEIDKIIQFLSGKPNKIEIQTHISTDNLSSLAVNRDKLTITYLRGRQLLKRFQEAGIETKRVRISPRADFENVDLKNTPQITSQDRAEIFIFNKFSSHYSGNKADD